MNLLGIDIGSSAVKAAVLRGTRVAGRVARAQLATHYHGVRAEVRPGDVPRAMRDAIAEIGPAAKKVDAIALSVMSPSWLAMDARGNALTPIITHQDRRSVEIAKELEARVGRERHLQLAGNRPFPGGISSTTWAWFLRHQPQLMKKADLCGHLNTFLHRQMTGARITDPSNASFMGFYSTLTMDGWNDELCEAVGIKMHRLPQVIGAEGVGGMITRAAARRFGLTHGTPMLAGCMDGSAAMLLAGNRPGQLVNSSGSTDVLALCTDRPRPHEKLLTRAVGVGRRWVSVGTIAAAGSALQWARQRLFADLNERAFAQILTRLAGKPQQSSVRFEPYLAGDRTDIEQRQGAFTGLTLGTTREQMLGAMIDALAYASAQRLSLLRQARSRMLRNVIITGGVQRGLDKVLYRVWPGRWRFTPEREATLRGLAALQP